MKTVPILITALLVLSTRVEAQPTPGRRPRGGPEGGFNEALFPSHTVPKNDREKKILDVLDDMDQNQRRGSMSVPANDGRPMHLVDFGQPVRELVG